MSSIDLHSHWLPGVDDGAPSVDATVEMLRLAHQGGTRILVATPHMFLPPFDNNDPRAIKQAYVETVQQLRQRLENPGHAFLTELSLYLGSENYLSPEFLDALDNGRVLALGNSFYLLVEFPAFLSVEMLNSAMERVLAAGFLPILAHVERYPPFCEQPKRLQHFLQLGCITQLNGGSLLGNEGSAQRKAAFSFLRQGLVQVIASDAHDTRRRAPLLAQVQAVVGKDFPESEVRDWMFDNPRRILANEALPIDKLASTRWS
ncbi:MAG: CpsB/CapC family capsule biosynthesis tyrosine phosphatase [Acidobacteriota bacterium]